MATRKKTTRKKTVTKSSPSEPTKDDRAEEENPRASEEAKAAAERAGEPAEKKRADTEKRLDEGRADSLDRDDPSLGWDVRQGTLARFEDGPRKYAREQLPDPEQLKAAGYAPVMPESQIED